MNEIRHFSSKTPQVNKLKFDFKNEQFFNSIKTDNIQNSICSGQEPEIDKKRTVFENSKIRIDNINNFIEKDFSKNLNLSIESNKTNPYKHNNQMINNCEKVDVKPKNNYTIDNNNSELEKYLNNTQLNNPLNANRVS